MACPLVDLWPEEFRELAPRGGGRRNLPVFAVPSEGEPMDQPCQHRRLAQTVRPSLREPLLLCKIVHRLILVGGRPLPSLPLEAIVHEGDRIIPVAPERRRCRGAPGEGEWL